MTAHTTSPLTIDPHLLQRLKGIQLRSRFLVRGLYNNIHRTADFGSSNEFVEHRDYRPGDEIRTIDWRLYARAERLYVKRFEMEANMKVNLLLDTSDSMRVAPPEGLPSKLDVAAVIAGAVATMVVTQQDAAGLLCLGDAIEERIPPKQGKGHLGMLYQHLGNPKGRGGGRFGELVRSATEHVGSRGVTLVLTDGWDDPEPLFDALKGLCVRGQDVSFFQVVDRREMEFPYDQMSEFRHPETGRKVVGDPLALKEGYMERLGAHLRAIESFCKSWRVDYVRLHNGEDLIKILSSHFLRRLLVLQ